MKDELLVILERLQKGNQALINSHDEVLEFTVSQQSELLNALSDSIYKEFQTYAYLPDLIEHIKSFNCG
tara:strand:- start:1 stop:207 length:207 start_codon:yes stop_codon:yes gene_type:complete